jgi:DNA-binding NtrC family response regulator
VRILAATNRNVEEAIRDGHFREDLFYRLNVLPIYVPSLRERREDIEHLVEHYIAFHSKKMNKNFAPLTTNILQQLKDYEWPGNIRELQNVVERAVILGQDPNLKLSDFVIQTKPIEKDYSRQATVTHSISSVQDLEYRSLIKAIEESHGNMSRAADILGICRDTLYRRLKKYSIQTKTAKSPYF